SYSAPFDVRLVRERKEDKDVFTVVQPDICVICDMSKMDDRGYAGSPDLIIEIISPSTAKKDLDYKYNLYEENSVKEYWIVFPDSNAIDQYFLLEGKYQRKGVFVNSQRFNSVTFPHLEINLEDIFYS
ncbi:MAG: Uma2 family endonuclease, partial [Bacteroidota bacterium]|nr:Uma2 family endonuclease [Bacteroidota bacterium]